MKADPRDASETGSCAAADSNSLPLLRWATPTVTRLRAGLAETGPNINYDGVEGTS